MGWLDFFKRKDLVEVGIERLVRAQYKTLDKGCPPEGAPPPLAGEVASNQLNPRSCAQCSDERQR